MKARQRVKLGVLIIIFLVCVMIGVLVVGLSPSPAPLFSLRQLKTSGETPPMAEFVVSNPSGTLVSLRRDAPQILSNQTWSSWTDAGNCEFFYLRPDQETTVTVRIPPAEHVLRIPFIWGYMRHASPAQRIAPRLHARFSNLMTTLRTERSVYGWSDPYGYLPDGTSFYFITNVELREPTHVP